MAVELATAYVSLVPSARGMGSKIQTEMGGPIAATGDKTGQDFGQSIMGGVKKIAKIGGGIGGALVGKSMLESGWKRLTTIKDATAALTVSMGDAAKAGHLMDQIVQVVTDTPFNLDQFAKAGQQLVGFGIDASKVPGMLTAIGEASATQGTRAGESAGELASTFGKMAAIGKVSMNDMWSLSNVGVQGLQILGNSFGVTTDEMQKLISKGAVPADKALQALTDGIMNGSQGVNGATVKLGGTMEALRGTLSGAAGGFKASIARLGASIIGPFQDIIQTGLTRGAKAIDTGGTLIAKTFTAIINTVKATVASIRDFFSSGFGADTATATFEHLSSIWTTLRGIASDLVPAIGGIIKSLSVASGAIGITGWRLLLIVADALVQVLSVTLVPAISAVSAVMEHNQWAVTGLFGAYTLWRGVKLGQMLIENAKTLAINTAAIATNSLAWVRNTAAMIVSKAQTVALMAMYAGEFLANIARVTAGLAAQAAAWVAQNAAAIAFKAVQLAITVGTAAWTAAQWLLNVALNANPIGLIVLAIAALIAIIVLVITNLDFFRGIWDTVWKFCSDLITTVTGWIGDRWQDLWNWLTGLWRGITGFFSGIWEGVVSGVRTAVGWVTNAWQSCIDGIKGFFSGLGHFAENVWNGITNAIKSVINGVIGVVNGAIGGVNDITGAVGIPAIPKIRPLATGGIVTSPTLAMVGEAGDEAVIPLKRMHEFMGEAGKQADQPDPLANLGAAVAEALSGWQVQLDGNGLARIVNNSNVRRARRG